MKQHTGSDIKRIQAELRKCQALMKQVRGTPHYDELCEVSRALNLALSRVKRNEQ